MSVHEHKDKAPSGPIPAQVVVVSSTRRPATDTSGARIVEKLEAAGHEVLDRTVIPDDAERIRATLAELARGPARVAILTGGTGISRLDVTPDAARSVFDRELPGFGELFRYLSFQEIGSAAMLSRATAGHVGPLLVFVVPGSERACELALDRLILPELPHMVGELQKEGAPAAAQLPESAEPDEEDDVVEAEFDEMPKPSGKLGQLGGRVRGVSVAASEDLKPPPEDPELPASGWKRAVFEVEGEITRDKWEDLPFDLEKIAPVMDVLHQAGERAVLKLPNGRKYTIFGYPDLQRPTSKVLAVGWGQPLAEVLALHRYPTLTGTTIEGDRGLLPSRSTSVEEVCESVTGRAPDDTSGEVYAVQGDAVWIERGRKVIRWDGRKELDDGNPKQVLASLVLHWSNR